MFARLLTALFTVITVIGLTIPANAETIRVGYIPVGDCLQLYVAEEMGYFAEEGITVEKTPLKGGSLIAMAVEAGELDAGWSNTASLVMAEDRGFDFAILAPGAFETEDHREHSLLVAKDSSITRFADLKGKTIAINALGNINEIAITALAEENGMDISTIRLVEVPFPQMLGALESGAVDAILTLEPFVTLGKSNGAIRILEPAALKSYGDRFLIAAWFAKRTWMQEHPGFAEGFRRAALKASEFIEANPAKAREMLTRHTKLSLELAQSITLPYFAQSIEDSDIQRIIDLTARFSFIKKPFSAKRLLETGTK
jgi:NitT/TauT family transport system substrate-binding protein